MFIVIEYLLLLQKQENIERMTRKCFINDKMNKIEDLCTQILTFIFAHMTSFYLKNLIHIENCTPRLAHTEFYTNTSIKELYITVFLKTLIQKQ